MSQFPVRLRTYTILLGVAALVALIAALVWETTAPSLTALAVLGSLAVVAEHQRVKLPTGLVLSPGFIVAMAAIFVFHEHRSYAGPLIVGALMGMNRAHLRKGARGWLVFNAANFALGTGAASIAFAAMPNAVIERLPIGIIAAVPAAIAVVVVESYLVALSYWVEERRRLRNALEDLTPAFVQALPFALVGLFLGRLYRDLGWPMVALLFVPVLAARGVIASYFELRATHNATVKMLVRALESKDAYTAGHAERVATYSQYIGEELGLMPWRLERLRAAALMHDIGKLVVPNQLLNKPGKLTSEEFAVVRRHEAVSVAMLSHIEFLAPIAPIAGGDHSTYVASEPAIEPYIVAVADAYDAMTSTRSYRRALTQEVAFQELRDKAGSQFHPRCVEALVHSIVRRSERHGAGFENSAQGWAVAPPVVGLGSAGLGDLVEGFEPALP